VISQQSTVKQWSFSLIEVSNQDLPTAKGQELKALETVKQLKSLLAVGGWSFVFTAFSRIVMIKANG